MSDESAPPVPDEAALRLAEALIFASAAPVLPRTLAQVLPETADADAVIAALRARYAGRGVELGDAGGVVVNGRRIVRRGHKRLAARGGKRILAGQS